MTVYEKDTTISVSSLSLSQVSVMLQQELRSIFEWAVGNRWGKLKSNVLKAKCMLLGSGNSLRENQKLEVSLETRQVEQIKETKLNEICCRGITFYSGQSFKHFKC